MNYSGKCFITLRVYSHCCDKTGYKAISERKKREETREGGRERRREASKLVLFAFRVSFRAHHGVESLVVAA